jgi:transcriptional regulator with GAF, ATPase, and Fis domain
MADGPNSTPLLSDPKRLLLDMAHEQSLPELLKLITARLSEVPRVALVRIWLAQPTADCRNCPFVDVCRDQSHCLQLVASGGQSTACPGVEWARLDGAFRRVPFGARKVGWIAASGEPIEAPELKDPFPDWVASPDWIRAEGIRGFAGQPLVHRGTVLGVLALFAREVIEADCMGWLRMIADHAASAIAMTLAFAENESLKKRLELENEYLREEVTRSGAFGELVGQSPALDVVTRQIDLVAPTDSTVLILGESGTGKELVAREIHRRSKRANKPLIKVNCAAVPRELYESEFFGHVRGAFTGALRDRTGRFELADQGTLFLDEIGEIPVELQAKLLRVLQEGELERVGEDRTRMVNVRLITATNRSLHAEVESGRFRQDLYYRLSVFPIELPPLRKRKEDIPILTDHFLEQAARKAGKPKPRLTVANVEQLQQYDWPGNVRELQHVIERSMIISTDGKLHIDLLPRTGNLTAVAPEIQDNEHVRTDAEIRQIEVDNILRALKVAHGKISGRGGAAELLGLKPTTLASRIKSLGIASPH